MAQKRALEGEGGVVPEKRRSWRDVSKPFLSKCSETGPTPFDPPNCSSELLRLLRSPHVDAITRTGLLLLPLPFDIGDKRSILLDRQTGLLWRVSRTDKVHVGYTAVEVRTPIFSTPRLNLEDFTDDAIMAQSCVTSGFRDLLLTMGKHYYPFSTGRDLEKAATFTSWVADVKIFLDEFAEDIVVPYDCWKAFKKLVNAGATFSWVLKRILVFFETLECARLAHWLEIIRTLERSDFGTTQGYLLYQLATCDGKSKYSFATLAHASRNLTDV